GEQRAGEGEVLDGGVFAESDDVAGVEPGRSAVVEIEVLVQRPGGVRAAGPCDLGGGEIHHHPGIGAVVGDGRAPEAGGNEVRDIAGERSVGGGGEGGRG